MEYKEKFYKKCLDNIEFDFVKLKYDELLLSINNSNKFEAKIYQNIKNEFSSYIITVCEWDYNYKTNSFILKENDKNELKVVNLEKHYDEFKMEATDELKKLKPILSAYIEAIKKFNNMSIKEIFYNGTFSINKNKFYYTYNKTNIKIHIPNKLIFKLYSKNI